MAVWKANKATRQTKDAVVLDLSDLSRQAERLREAAEQRAREILENAQREAQQLIDAADAKGREQGYAAGFEQGLEQGREQGRSEAREQMTKDLKRLSEGWTRALDHWEQQRSAMERQARTAVLDLSLRIAERIVHRTVELDRELVVDQLSEALSHILRRGDAKVRIHPEGRAVVEQAIPELAERFQRLEHIEIAEDPTVGHGGCVVEYGQGQVDATIDTQLDRIVRALKPTPEHQPPNSPDQQAEAATDEAQVGSAEPTPESEAAQEPSAADREPEDSSETAEAPAANTPSGK